VRRRSRSIDACQRATREPHGQCCERRVSRAAVVRRSERTRSSARERRRTRRLPRRETAASRQIGQIARPTVGGGMSGHARERSEQIQSRERSEQIQYCRPRRETTTSDSRCSRRRSAGGDGRTTLLRSARSDEDGGNPANIAASGASNRTRRDARAASNKGALGPPYVPNPGMPGGRLLLRS